MIRNSIIAAGVVCAALAAAPSSAQTAATKKDEIQTHARHAQEYLHGNRPDLAANEFRAIVALDPKNVDARGNLGVLLFFHGDLAGAAPQLRAALRLNPDLPRIQALLGMCERRMGDAAAAQPDLEKAFAQLKEDKMRVQAGMELIELYYGTGQLDKAAGVVGALRQIAPTDVNILYTANRIYSDLADESMLSVAMLAPDSARMHQLMAHEAARQGNTQGAIQQFREAVKLDPNIPGIHSELAAALSLSSLPSDQDEAEREYQAALKENPFDELSECRLGEIAAHESDQKAAFTHFSRALQLQPNDVDANVGLARILIAMNQPEKAEKLLERAAKVDPFNSVIRYHLSTLYRNEGRTEEARREMDEFKKIKGMKAELDKVYETMRLRVGKRETPDESVPQ